MSDDNHVYKALLESTKAIPWKIDWTTMQFAYIGPQIEDLLGWTPESWKTAQDWADRMHEDDRRWVVDYCISQSKCGIDHEADYRALTKDGGYVWLRDVVHVVRKPSGEVDSLVGFMFDISERKRTEEQLLALQKELRELSYKDGLTSIANRRMFDDTLTAEWLAAVDAQLPLSLVLIDIDYFKQYNDHFGHMQGDACLRMVAQALNRVATRAKDLSARYGGEEFALLLPSTDVQSAISMAQRYRAYIESLDIAHPTSPTQSSLTVSIGVGSITPSGQDSKEDFLARVDQLLYKAKQQGRNCVVSN